MKRIIRTVLVGTATVGVAVGMAMPANALPHFPPGVCHVVGDRVFCQLR